jgi:hypothetical protein
MHQPTSYIGSPVLLLDSPGPEEDSSNVEPDDAVEDPLVDPSLGSPLLAPVLEVDGSVEMLTDVSGSVVIRSSPVDDVPSSVPTTPPSSPQPRTVDNAQAISHLDAPTISGARVAPAILIKVD